MMIAGERRPIDRNHDRLPIDLNLDRRLIGGGKANGAEKKQAPDKSRKTFCRTPLVAFYQTHDIRLTEPQMAGKDRFIFL